MRSVDMTTCDLIAINIIMKTRRNGRKPSHADAIVLKSDV
jgi:hypothetical protein